MSAKKRGRKSRHGTEPFCCDLCKATSVVNPSRRRQGNDEVAASVVKRSPGPRYKTDPKTGQMLVLCNACGGCTAHMMIPNRNERVVNIGHFVW